ncbi:MAG TPA: glycerophosphodiester phosphodiesterase family protein [Candidatus Binatia bacterium]|nr:glycerophosphodiester phosphodiesterase family protein [Candidatus Binatia bacterium]
MTRLLLRSFRGRGAARALDFPGHPASWIAVSALLAAGCGDAGTVRLAPAEIIRDRIAMLAPAASFGHRGTGINRPGHALPENSIPSYVQAIADGADGIELDVELTSDGGLLVMHDDTLDRTTTCAGCVNAYTLADAQRCFLLDGDGHVTDLHPPTLGAVFAALPDDAMVNVELKVYGEACATPPTGARELAAAAVREIEALGVEDRTLFSSFGEVAAASVKVESPGLYSALLVSLEGTDDWPATVDLAERLGLDAIHPLFGVAAEGVQAALGRGLQVNVWTVNSRNGMEQSIDKGVTAIITDEPRLLAEVIDERRG